MNGSPGTESDLGDDEEPQSVEPRASDDAPWSRTPVA
jgi:hypothetical protein